MKIKPLKIWEALKNMLVIPYYILLFYMMYRVCEHLIIINAYWNGRTP